MRTIAISALLVAFSLTSLACTKPVTPAAPAPEAGDTAQYGPVMPVAQPPVGPLGPVEVAPPPGPEAPAAGGARTYHVVKGDTLWSIARRELGASGDRIKVRVEDIKALNPGLTAETLKAGSTIKLPAR
jgi:Tfp pilus assembly protein FimV